MIYTVTLNPALDKTVEIPGMALDTVNRITEMRTDPGGKGINVSKVIAKLGGDSRAVGILGGESGRTLEKLLENENFTTQFRFVEGQTRTNIKIIDRAHEYRHQRAGSDRHGCRFRCAAERPSG